MKTTQFISENESLVRTLLSVGNRIVMGNIDYDEPFMKRYLSATAVLMRATLDTYITIEETTVFFNDVTYLQLRLEND